METRRWKGASPNRAVAIARCDPREAHSPDGHSCPDYSQKQIYPVPPNRIVADIPELYVVPGKALSCRPSPLTVGNPSNQCSLMDLFRADSSNRASRGCSVSVLLRCEMRGRGGEGGGGGRGSLTSPANEGAAGEESCHVIGSPGKDRLCTYNIYSKP